jgi:polygalacturonase
VVVNAGEYNILEFGAVRNKLSTSAIQKAIDSCNSHGGGTVIVPDGVFITGTIILKSNVNLFLSPGSELRSSVNLDDFRIGTSRYGMIFCQDATNVSITGEGIINGLGSSFYETDQNHVYPEFDKKYTRQKEGYMPEGMFFTDGPLKRKPRPWMAVVFFHCNQVTIRDITVKDTPIWAVRFGYCEDVLVDGITILNNLI